MSDAPVKPIRSVQTYPGTRTAEGDRLLDAHHLACGPDWPNKTDAQRAHTDQVIGRKVGWNGGPIFEYTCPSCGIRWRRE